MRKKLHTLKLFGFSLKTILASSLALGLGLGVLFADLTFGGPTDDLLWNVSGETDPLEQILGGLQYLANATRQTPETAPNTPIQNKPTNPFGLNAFLELEALPQNRESSMKLIAEGGFGWLRQQFAWEDIEIQAKGDFIDRRNDRTQDGAIDAKDYISAWEKYDQIVSLAHKYNINLVARLSGPTPVWALPENVQAQPPDQRNTHTPPANTDDFVDYAVTIAKRYQGYITHYQIWNEPNLYPEWGDQLVNPAGYTDLLCRTYHALKAVDPNIVVLTGAIGPTIDLSGRDAYDILYLQKMYEAGAADCFDVLSAQGYGLFSGPTDRRLRPYTINFGRHQWLRDVMVANGDSHKPIWISEAAWNPVPDTVDPAIRETYGIVTPEQAAEWAPLAYERALQDWPWIGVIHYWYLKRPDDREINQPWYYFRLIEHDWRTTPTYDSLQTYIASETWHHPDYGWSRRARERLPQVLIGGLAVLFIGYTIGQAFWIRFIGTPTDI